MYYTMSIIFLLFSFSSFSIFLWSFWGFFVIYFCVAGKIAQWLRTLLVLGKDPDFDSQHPYGSSQPSKTLVPGDLTDTVQNTHIHEVK